MVYCYHSGPQTEYQASHSQTWAAEESKKRTARGSAGYWGWKPMGSEISFHHDACTTYKPQLFQMMTAWKWQIYSLKQNKENLNN